MKKIISLVLALAMILMVGAAFAAGEPASITVNNTGTHKPETGADDDTTYKWYRIFDASLIDDTDPSAGVRYYTNSSTVKAALETVTVNGHTFSFTAVPGTDPTEWNISSNFVDADAPALATALEALKSNWVEGTTFKANTEVGVQRGYYLVTSTLGSKIILDTLGQENINEKNEYITDTKSVPKTDYDVGELVNFTITVNIPATTDFTLPVVVHDTMDDKLGLPQNVHATVTTANDFDSHITLVNSDDFTAEHLADHAAETDRNRFDFVLDIRTLSGATTITITYQAEVLSTAAADTGYVNTEFTQYSEYTTKPKDVTVKTYDFTVAKVFTGATTDNTLYAKFEIKEGGTAIGLIQGTDATHLVRPDADDTATPITEFEVYQNAPVNIRGLSSGTYVLHETWTKPGYNALTEDITVTIAEDGTVSINDNAGSDIALASGTVTVTNNAGTELPSTGGIGTTIFYILGGLLVVGAAVILVARRKAQD